MVSLGAGQSRVYDPARLRPLRCERVGDLAHDAAAHGAVAHDALRRLGAAGFELRLDEHERLPAGRGEAERRRQRELDRDERDVAGHELRRERQLGQRARVDPLEHVTTRSSRRILSCSCP